MGRSALTVYGMSEHPLYTVDRALACTATTWGGMHECSCVYRKAVCDGINHLCMCGSGWFTDPPETCLCALR